MEWPNCSFLLELSVYYSLNGRRKHFLWCWNLHNMWCTCNIQETGAEVVWRGVTGISLKQNGAPSWYRGSLWTKGLHPKSRVIELLTRFYKLSNDIPVHSISTGCPTLTQSRWAPSCHTWRQTNLTWQKWVGISVLLIKMGSRKNVSKGHSIKEKAWGLFHRCFAHWPESSGTAGNGVIGSVKVRSTEGHFTLFRVLKKYTSRTAHTLSFFSLFLTKQRHRQIANTVKDRTELIHKCRPDTQNSSVKSNLQLYLVFAELQWCNFTCCCYDVYCSRGLVVCVNCHDGDLTTRLEAQFLNTGCVHYSVDWAFWYY